MGAYGSIDTDAAIGTILAHFDSDYIYHVIEDSISYKFRPFNTPMANIVDVINRQFIGIENNSPDYIEKVQEVKAETFREIIKIICDKYDLGINADLSIIDISQLYSLAHILYDLLVSRFTNYMFDFFTSYIINNSNDIYSYLIKDENVKKTIKESGINKKYTDPKFIIIHANINIVIYNMISYGISFNEIVNYCLDRGSAQFVQSIIVDNGDFYKNHYVPYILNQQFKADTLTNIKLNFQQKTYEFVPVNTIENNN